MDTIKCFVRDWLPPAVLRMVRKFLTKENTFSGAYNTWSEALADSTGYNADNILTKVLAATLKVKRGEVAFERDSVTFDRIEYEWPVLAGLMWAATRNDGKLNVLDFGGSLGSSYFQCRRFLNGLSEVRWNVVEQSHYVECGNNYVQDEILRFYPSINDCLTENAPNVVLLSSVLQYLEEPYQILKQLLACNADILILDRLIINCTTFNKMYVQHVPKAIYCASYPCWSFSKSALKALIGEYYDLISDFTSLDFPSLTKINSFFEGFIWCKKP